ncbi:MAG: hypothetical protein M1820_008585 [Bogoriella megaspora]|nr:MAG: hypothetical protein M1820_008585 [Bogoriella megaspora]
MAASRLPTTVYSSTHFLESAGCIIFHLPTRRILLINYLSRSHWVLPKGRRNLHESLPDNALRECREETGYDVKFLPVTMATRCTPAADEGGVFVPDVPRVADGVAGEPFAVMVRDTTLSTRAKREVFGEGGSVKLIHWYVAHFEGSIDGGGEGKESPKGEDQFRAEWFGYEEAVERAKFETDRDVLRRAIGIVRESYPDAKGV